MAKYSNLKDLFTAIANAIRSKTGETAPIVADDFPSVIESIVSTEGEDALISTDIEEYTNDRVTRLRTSAFKSCRSIRKVSFPFVTSVPVDCFADCTLLSSINFPNATMIDVAAFQAIGIDGAEEVKIICPKVAYIANKAFADVSRLRRIDIAGELDNWIGEIWSAAFNCCAKLNTVIIRTSNGVCKLRDTRAFEGTPIESGEGYIYVPSALVDSYKTAENWSAFASQIRAIEDYPEICG